MYRQYGKYTPYVERLYNHRNMKEPVSLKHDGTDGTATTDGTGATGHKSYRFAAKINLRALTQTSHEVVHT